MSKRFVLVLLFATVFFLGLYLIWTGWVNPRPDAVADEAVPQSASAANNVPASVTIVPAALNKDGVPANLGVLALTQTMTGTEALAEFSQLHGESFDLAGGYMAHYEGGGKQATLWVAIAKDPAAADSLRDQMAQKIGTNNPMFQDLQQLNIAGRPLYSAVGQGQQHFFYSSNDKVIWLAADPSQAPDALHSLWSAVK